MSSIYRSEELCLTQLFLQSEAAFACISRLGELGLVQFNDLNCAVNSFQRKFVNEVRRCDEMERKLCFLERELKKSNFRIWNDGEIPSAPQPKEMINMENQFENLETNLREMNANEEALRANYLKLTELKHVLVISKQILDESRRSFFPDAGDAQYNLADDNYATRLTQLEFVSGVILRGKVADFESVLWNAFKGNVDLQIADIEMTFADPRTGDCVQKYVFVIFFQGQHLKNIIKNICNGFLATIHPCPTNPQERHEMTIGVMNRLKDLQTILHQTGAHKKEVLSQVSLHIRTWLIKVRKVKAIYHTLNQFNVDIAQKCLIGECWCPLKDLPQVQLALRVATESSGSSVPSIAQRIDSNKTPPTFNRTNKFTASFQTPIDAYGQGRSPIENMDWY